MFKAKAQGVKGFFSSIVTIKEHGRSQACTFMPPLKGRTITTAIQGKKSAYANRLTILSLLFLILTSIWLVLVPRSMEVQRLLVAWHVRSYNAVAAEKARQELRQRLAHDPSLGITVESLQGKQPCNGVLVSLDLPLLLVVLGDCKDCKADSVKVWQEVANSQTWHQRIQVAVLFQSEEKDIAQEAKRRGWRLPILADPKGGIAEALNAQFTPRAYGFVKGRLVWKQDEPMESQIALLRQFAEYLFGQQRTDRLMDMWSSELRQQAWGKDIQGR